jgi:hypothetical protein
MFSNYIVIFLDYDILKNEYEQIIQSNNMYGNR